MKAKLYPNHAQARALNQYIETSRHAYNQALEQRIYAVKSNGAGFSLYDQYRQLTKQRAADMELAAMPVEIARDGLRRLDSAYQNFFRRCKEGAKKKGFPRFKSARQYNSFTVTHFKTVITNGRIRIPGIKERIRCRGLQPIFVKPKRFTIVRRGGSWFARILIDDGLTAPPKRDAINRVGLDVGLNSFIATSDGDKVDCPKHYRRLSQRLRRAQQRMSRCKKGSNRRTRSVGVIQRVHAKIADCRHDFTHQLSRMLVNQYDFIAAEKLNIAGMVRSNLAKSILDAGWGQFLNRIAYKAERAGCTFILVNPNYTSQECSQCGEIVKKDLSVRVHECKCGLVLDRDVNAARNILRRGMLSAPLSGNDGVTDDEGRPLPASRLSLAS